MSPERVEALAACHAAFADDIVYTHRPGLNAAPGGGDVDIDPLAAVLFHSDADMPFSSGKSLRQRGYEIRKADVAFRPANDDRITDAAGVWRVIDVEDYEEADAWRVRVAVSS